jgi:hypothetical protein
MMVKCNKQCNRQIGLAAAGRFNATPRQADPANWHRHLLTLALSSLSVQAVWNLSGTCLEPIKLAALICQFARFWTPALPVLNNGLGGCDLCQIADLTDQGESAVQVESTFR